MRNKPRLSFLQIWNMSPIYKYLGADGAVLPYLWLARLLTRLLVQPIVGR